MRKILKALLFLPLSLLTYFTLWYVLIGQDLIPSPNGMRWVYLIVLSIICTIVRGVMALDEDDNKRRKEREWVNSGRV